MTEEINYDEVNGETLLSTLIDIGMKQRNKKMEFKKLITLKKGYSIGATLYKMSLENQNEDEKEENISIWNEPQNQTVTINLTGYENTISSLVNLEDKLNDYQGSYAKEKPTITAKEILGAILVGFGDTALKYRDIQAAGKAYLESGCRDTKHVKRKIIPVLKELGEY